MKKLGLFSWLTRERVPRDKIEPSNIGMPRVKQVVKDGLVVNEYEFVHDYSPSASLLVNDFALSNLLASGITPDQVGVLEGDRLSIADLVNRTVES